MKIIVGLGNYGPGYTNNRHNAGFMVVDKFAHDNGLSWKEKSKLSAYIAEGEGYMLIKPTTYMNDSGRAVNAVMQFYKTDDILVICDDIDRDFGSIRTRMGGGDGGNNGLKSVIGAIGKDFARIRIGAQNEHRTPENAASFVLSDFNSSEKELLPQVLQASIDQIDNFVSGDFPEHTVSVKS